MRKPDPFRKREETIGNVQADYDSIKGRSDRKIWFFLDTHGNRERYDALKADPRFRVTRDGDGPRIVVTLTEDGPEPDPVPGTLVDMRELITERAAFARTLAEDGAYFDAASVLQRLAIDIRVHAETKKLELEALIEGSK